MIFSNRTIQLFSGQRSSRALRGMIIWEEIERASMKFVFNQGVHIPLKTFTQYPGFGKKTVEYWLQAFVDAGAVTIGDGEFYTISPNASWEDIILSLRKIISGNSNLKNNLNTSNSIQTARARARESLDECASPAEVVMTCAGIHRGHANTVVKDTRAYLQPRGLFHRATTQNFIGFAKWYFAEMPEDYNFPTNNLPHLFCKWLLEQPEMPDYQPLPTKDELEID